MALPAEQIEVPARGWRIDPWKAAALGSACWIGVGVVALLVLSGHAASIDAAGLLFWRTSPGLAPAGPPLLLEMVRDLTAVGGVLLRNLLALAAALALVFLRLRREATMLILTVAGG